MLQVLVLGPVEARVGVEHLRIGGRKQQTMLARLATSEGHPVSPDHLVDDLWGQHPPRDPVHALQAHVSRLRATLPVDVEASSGGYRLAPGASTLDATEFAALAERGRAELAAGTPERAAATLRAAEGCWRGPAFGDLSDVSGLRPVAAGLESRRTRVLADRIEAEIACGDQAAVLGELRSLVTRHPLQEQWWALLVRALHQDGQRGDSLAAYQEARTVIVEELGLEPGQQLVQAHRAVLQDDSGTTRTPSVVPVRRAPARDGRRTLPEEVSRRVQAPFSGRLPELAELEAAWRRRDRGPGLVALSGEPGIGKTRLAAEFAARCGARGARVLFGRCDETIAVPYQPLMEMLQDYVDSCAPADLPSCLGRSPGPLVRLLPRLSTLLAAEVVPGPASDPETERYRLFEAVAEWLAHACETEPLLVVIDDLQWADEATLLLLRRLLRSPTPLPMVIVTTHRDREHQPAHATTAAIADLVRHSEQVSRVPLAGLSRADLEELLADRIETGSDTGPTPGDLAVSIEAASGGNPLFALELARQTVDTRGPAGAPATGLPQGLRELVEQRVGRLPPPVQELLTCAAVIGRSFDPTLAQEVLGLEASDLDARLDAAAYTLLIEASTGPRLEYVFSHDVVRAALYDAVPPLRRAELHRLVATSLERRHLVDLASHYHQLAHHFAAAAVVGPTTEAIHYLVLAGRSALEQRAPAVAVDHYTRALGLSPGSLPPARESDLLAELGIAQLQAGRPEYRTTLLRSAELARAEGDTARLAAAAVANSRGWWSSTAEIDDERVAVLEAALAADTEADPATRSRLLAGWSLETVRDPERRLESVRRSTEALQLARRCGDDLMLGRTLADHYAVTYASFSDPRGCARISAELLEVATRSGDDGLQMMAAVGHTQATLMLGDLETSDDFLERADRSATALSHHSRLWMVRTWQAGRLVLRGHLVEAEDTAAAALDLGVATDQPDAMTWFAGQLFTIRWMQGRLHELIDEIETQVATQADGIPAWRAAHALALAEVGRAADAEKILDEFVSTDLHSLPYDMLWLQGVAYLCSACRAVGRTDMARVLYDALTPYAGLLADNATIGAGPVDLHLGQMARLLGEDTLAERHRAAAVRTCARIDAPLWLRRARDV
ncbi:AfsR/SARP family transcriptional regulator [Nocardioides sp. OK12]|uniref:AfsR/SARP family transcriptional regulator n=1 Tax=Nocardioides sp. OK12 TaxID=2758661 RepID=UPI0021C35596|nr:AfsR/SARP family transcriptional regulator [Nocardioides sp. OK12]